MQKRLLLITIIFTAAATGTQFTPNAYAEAQKCYGQYGQEITCPLVNKSFSVQKRVRISGATDWSETVNVKSGTTVEFQITVKNTGEAKVSNVNVIDVLPDNLKEATGATQWVINDFESGQEETRTFSVKANDTNITDNQEKCVANVVNVQYNGNQEASDTAVVCISRNSHVLPNQLPETADSSTNSLRMVFGVILAAFALLSFGKAIELSTKRAD
ncbi:DUF11 domain-containing protein [candidate division WWE3 bacterium]|nr:DUF11 domain-containing protein [candidate division WWE3 bacterium]